MKIPGVMTTILEKSINRFLGLDPVAKEDLARHSGKTIAIEMRGLDMLFYIGLTDEGVAVFSEEPEQIDARLVGTPVALMKMGLSSGGRETEDILFSCVVEIVGDIELGQQLKKILNEIDVDFEEQLSRITGDVVAHQVGNLIREGKRWGERSVASLEMDVAEYLQEETGQLPRAEEVDEFVSAIDVLRSDADRLEARVVRLVSACQSTDDGAK